MNDQNVVLDDPQCTACICKHIAVSA